ncbi:MAG: SMC-Scp complex subunit ScpB [Armatimonadetes bacterium]|nr:SMC-Scp complex subunit ScpB [Armatimonadota bacterium]
MTDSSEIRRAVECLLFVSGAPLGTRDLALALECEEASVVSAAEELAARDPEVSGLRVQQVAGGWQMVTRPEYALAVARFVGKRAQKLSKAALEALAILAYNQPSTQPEIEAIRGVDSSGVLKSLIERNLVKEAGRRDGPGRPILYETTDGFLVYFGLNSLDDLPDQSVLESMLAETQSRVEERADEQFPASTDGNDSVSGGQEQAQGVEETLHISEGFEPEVVER